jgi:hypothetical protein
LLQLQRKSHARSQFDKLTCRGKFAPAVVAALSKKELMAMDELNEKIKENERNWEKNNGIPEKAQVQIVNILMTSHSKRYNNMPMT